MSKRFKSYVNNYEVEMKEKGKATFKSYINDFMDDEDEEERKEEDSDTGTPSPVPSTSADNLCTLRITKAYAMQEEVENSASAFFDNLKQPNLLPGEQVIAQAESALRFAPFSDRKQGISGNLFVTNFKVSFVTADKSSYSNNDAKHRQRNKLIDDHDIPLTCIDSVYQVISGGKRRALVLGQMVNSTSKYLEIHCKDFRIHVFGFKFVNKDQVKMVTNTILHHSCPVRDDLLFAYEFASYWKRRENIQHTFFAQQDWRDELERLGCESEWTVTDVNLQFNMSTSLPEFFVVPTSLTNIDIQRAADQYAEKRLPTWCYTLPKNKACLVRMSLLMPNSDFKKYEEKILMAVKHASGDRNKVEVVNLTHLCPSLMDIRVSGQRLMSLCMTDSPKEFYSFDSTWLSRLDSTQWLQHVATCLRVASEVAESMMEEEQSFALREETGYDMSCIISCLVQLILDPYYRTQQGFAALVQREWVVMGHPFQRRSRLVQGADSEQSPVFLLFLDCVWQLLQQFPSRLALTETFLTTLWDTLHLGVTDTFLFDSAWHRHRFLRDKSRLCLPSAWDWHLQFSEDDILLFNNPLFSLQSSCDIEKVIARAKGSLKRAERNTSVCSYAQTLTEFHGDSVGRKDLFKKPNTEALLPVSSTAARLQLWSQCFLRWCVPAQILGGGQPAGYLQQCLLVEEVVCLEHRLKTLERKKSQKGQRLNQDSRPYSGLVFSVESQSALNSGYLTSSFPFPAAVTAQTQHKLISGPLSLYLHDSLVQYDYANSDD